MPENAQSEPEKTLSVKQQQAISHIVAGMALGDVAKKLAINEKTLWRWRQDPVFQTGLREAENRLFDESISKLKRTMSEAIDCLKRNMGEKVSPYVQVQAASKLVDANMDLHIVSQIEDKIQLFESLMKEAGLK